MSSVQLPPPVVEGWLSTGRFGIYLAATEHNTDRALALYEWNARATSACLQDIGHFEVLLRNRYDVQLQRHHPGWSDADNALWHLEDGRERTRFKQRHANSMSRKKLDHARGRLPDRTHGHIVANLTFGFWSALSAAERANTIWTPVLSQVFPGRARGPIHDRLTKLNGFRNRLAHWEPLFSRTTALLRQLDDVDTLFQLLDPDVARWVGQRSQVVQLLRGSPEPLFGACPRDYLGSASS